MKKAKHTEKKVKKEISPVKKQIAKFVIVFTLLLLGTVLAVLYGSGYRLFVNNGGPKIGKTGILHVTSLPTGAQVYINGNLTTASDNSVNLSPNKYTVRVSKDGFNDWQKDVYINDEEVMGVDALLFPKSPTLQSISTFGVEEALIDPSGTKLAIKIASQSAKRNGIYVFDMTARSLPILQGQGSANQIADDTVDTFSQSKLSWSPDSKHLMASISADTIASVPPDSTNLSQSSVSQALRQSSGLPTYYLLKTDRLNEIPEDVSSTTAEVEDLWKNQLLSLEKARNKSLKPKVSDFAAKHFNILSWSPDDKKILYQASASAEMPVFLKPRRIGNNLLYERRDLKKGAIYVYDTTEDINTRIIDTVEQIPYITWFPDSEHLVYVSDKKVQIVEKDGANMTTVYGGPFIGNFVFPWPDGSRIVILTNLGNPNVSPTLYTVSLK